MLISIIICESQICERVNKFYRGIQSPIFLICG